MNITRIEDAPIVRKVEGFEGRKLSDGPAAALVHIQLDAGAVLDPHASPVDIAIFVLEGEAELSCGDEKAMVKAGMLSQTPKGMLHGMRNTGKGPFRVLVIKSLS
jgi:quercetin dioxygenase-like cupin family protein